MAVAALAAGSGGFSARPDALANGVLATSVGVDVDPSGNTATSLGPIDSCRRVASDETFTIDVYIDDVANLALLNTFFTYDGSVVNVVGNQVTGLFMEDGFLLIELPLILFSRACLKGMTVEIKASPGEVNKFTPPVQYL